MYSRKTVAKLHPKSGEESTSSLRRDPLTIPHSAEYRILFAFPKKRLRNCIRNLEKNLHPVYGATPSPYPIAAFAVPRDFHSLPRPLFLLLLDHDHLTQRDKRRGWWKGEKISVWWVRWVVGCGWWVVGSGRQQFPIPVTAHR